MATKQALIIRGVAYFRHTQGHLSRWLHTCSCCLMLSLCLAPFLTDPSRKKRRKLSLLTISKQTPTISSNKISMSLSNECLQNMALSSSYRPKEFQGMTNLGNWIKNPAMNQKDDRTKWMNIGHQGLANTGVKYEKTSHAWTMMTFTFNLSLAQKLFHFYRQNLFLAAESKKVCQIKHARQMRRYHNI